jgi:alkylation response protein AidB-like acyl-CoA dehydrogenase
MNFALTEDQILIRDSAERFLAEASDSAAVREAMMSPQGWDAAVWQRIAGELGWCALDIEEAHGGLGLGAVETTLLLEAMGRRLLCAPYFATSCLAANLLAQAATAAARERFLPRIAAGTLRATANFDAASPWPVAQARPEGGWRLHGDCRKLLDGATAEILFVIAQTDGEPALFAVAGDMPGVQRQPLQGWDLTRRFAAVGFANVELPAEARIGATTLPAGLRRAEARAALSLAAEQLGGAQQCLDLTLAYVANRKQFGRAIASFQAVKHRCAEMMVRIEATRSMVYGAAAFAAATPDVDALTLECTAAKALASETFFWCAQEAVQLHGGVGFTWEYDPQLYFKRAQAGSQWLAAPDRVREVVAGALIDAAVAP